MQSLKQWYNCTARDIYLLQIKVNHVLFLYNHSVHFYLSIFFYFFKKISIDLNRSFSIGDAEKLSQAELVIIDEAAAIPLPLVKKLLGPYLVFMASTINGYEGTGRSLSLKLLEQLRQQSTRLAVTANDGGSASRTLHECELKVKFFNTIKMI